MRSAHALVAVADPAIRSRLAEALRAAGGEVEAADGGAAARAVLERHPVTLVLAGGGLAATEVGAILADATALRPTAPVVVVQPGEDEEQWTAEGAFDVLADPHDHAEASRVFRRAAHEHELRDELRRLRGRRASPGPLDPIVGRSEPIEVFRERLGAIAAHDRSVLLVGERGTGRELAARTLHALSARRAEPFVRLECALLGDSARDPHDAGWAEDALDRAGGGTLFLGGLERLGAGRQTQLARALATAAPTGGARMVASATRDLEAETADGRFDRALRGALAQELLRVPPLRERGRDVVLIARLHVEALCALNGLPPARISPAAVALLERHAWPGNVAELRDAVERALTLATDGVVAAEYLPESVRQSGDAREDGARARPPRRFREAKRRVVDSFEKSYLEELLGWHAGNVTAAAEQAGMLRSALQRLLRKHDIRSSDFRRVGDGAVPPPREPSP